MTSLSEPDCYYWIAAVSTLFFVWEAVVGGRSGQLSRRREWLFLASIALCLFAGRWPFLLFPNPINVDEGQWVACAIKATKNALPWLGFESTTSGPLNCDILVLPALIGFKVTFFSSRVVGLCLVVGSLWAVYLSLKWLYEPIVGRLAVAPPLLFLSFTSQGDFVHYSSEHLSIFLTTAAFAAAAFSMVERRPVNELRAALALAGFLIGCTPFAKLQAAPLAAVELVAIGGFLLLRPGTRNGSRTINLTFFVGATAIMPLLMLISVAYAHTLKDAIISYLMMARLHIEAGPPVWITYFLRHIPEYGAFVAASGAVILISVCFGGRIPKPTFPQTWGCLCSTLLVATASYAIYAAHRPYVHYLLLSIMPMALVNGNALGLVFRSCGSGKVRMGAGAAFLALYLPSVYVAARTHNGYGLKSFSRIPPEVAAIARYVKPGDLLSVWGWKPEYYVYTRTIMATRDSHTQRQIDHTPYQEYFRRRFFNDLLQNPPSAFVDGVSPGSFTYADRETQGVENFPALASYLHSHYTLKEEINGVRIYVREENAARPAN